MANIFQSVEIKRPNRTAFSLSHHNLFTTNFGRLTPVCVLDTVPGDTHRISAAPVVRFTPMVSPPFGAVDVSMVWFAVPMRLTNKKFQKFITGYYQTTEGSSQFAERPNMMFKFPESGITPHRKLSEYYDVTKLRRYSLLDYLGYKTANEYAPAGIRLECARVLSFWYIYFEYFVDQNIGYRPDPVLSPEATILLRGEDGNTIEKKSICNWEEFTQIVLRTDTQYPAVAGYLTIGDCIEYGKDIDLENVNVNVFPWLFGLPHKCWPKDYFTSALPWAQKGNPVSVPVVFGDKNVQVPFTGNVNVTHADVKSYGSAANNGLIGTKGTGVDSLLESYVNTGTNSNYNPIDNGPATLKGSVTGKASLTTAEAAFTINELRTSYALQSWLEKNARCGSRYVEQILSHFGVRTSDARLQRPEYLGGFKIPVHVSSTAQTSESGDTPQGNLSGQGLAAGASKPITFFSEEHSIIIGMMYVQPKAYYNQGMPRLLRRERFSDFYFPEFAHLGEQSITNSEIYYDPSAGDVNDDTFGYQSRYSEYKFMNNEYNGDFNHDSLKSWLFGIRNFQSRPSLSPEFLQVSPSTDPYLNHVFPVVEEDGFDKLLCQVDFNINALRPMPKYGTPYL